MRAESPICHLITQANTCAVAPIAGRKCITLVLHDITYHGMREHVFHSRHNAYVRIHVDDKLVRSMELAAHRTKSGVLYSEPTEFDVYPSSEIKFSLYRRHLIRAREDEHVGDVEGTAWALVNNLNDAIYRLQSNKPLSITMQMNMAVRGTSRCDEAAYVESMACERDTLSLLMACKPNILSSNPKLRLGGCVRALDYLEISLQVLERISTIFPPCRIALVFVKAVYKGLTAYREDNHAIRTLLVKFRAACARLSTCYVEGVFADVVSAFERFARLAGKTAEVIDFWVRNESSDTRESNVHSRIQTCSDSWSDLHNDLESGEESYVYQTAEGMVILTMGVRRVEPTARAVPAAQDCIGPQDGRSSSMKGHRAKDVASILSPGRRFLPPRGYAPSKAREFLATSELSSEFPSFHPFVTNTSSLASSRASPILFTHGVTPTVARQGEPPSFPLAVCTPPTPTSPLPLYSEEAEEAPVYTLRGIIKAPDHFI